MARGLTVTQVLAGSIPVIHPKFFGLHGRALESQSVCKTDPSVSGEWVRILPHAPNLGDVIRREGSLDRL